MLTGFPDGPCWQYSIATKKPIGPFPSINDFHDFLLDPSRAFGDSREKVLAIAEKLYPKNYRICFTHGDLRPHNLLVENGRVRDCRLGDSRVVSRFYRLESNKRISGQNIPVSGPNIPKIQYPGFAVGK